MADSRTSGYDSFAPIFERDWSSFSPRLFPTLMRLVGNQLSPGAEVLDLCCGTGQLARLLGDSGFRVTGIDNSPEMLKLARINAPAARFLLADARSFDIAPTFQAVFCTYDSLNHLLRAHEFRSALKNVARCLEKRGRFVFDLNTEEGYRREWQGYYEVREGEDYFYLNRASYDPRRRLGQTHCSLFERQGDSWQRSEIRLDEKCYAVVAVENWLKAAGFAEVRKYSLDLSLKRHPFGQAAPRVLFSCRRGE
jgi:SAM-dependent methyltransferase